MEGWAMHRVASSDIRLSGFALSKHPRSSSEARPSLKLRSLSCAPSSTSSSRPFCLLHSTAGLKLKKPSIRSSMNMEVASSVAHPSSIIEALLEQEADSLTGEWHETARKPFLELKQMPLQLLLEEEAARCSANSEHRPILTSTFIVLTSPGVGLPYEVELTTGPLSLDGYSMFRNKEITHHGSHALTLTLKLSLNHCRQGTEPAEVEVSIGKVTIETRARRQPGRAPNYNPLSQRTIHDFACGVPGRSEKTVIVREVENDYEYSRLPRQSRTPVTVISAESARDVDSLGDAEGLQLRSILVYTVYTVEEQSIPMSASEKVCSWLGSSH